VIPHLAPYTGTISGANSSPTRIRSIRNFGAHELIMAGQANTHNLPPYNDMNNFGHRSMSNHLAVFKINKDLDSSSLQLKYIPSQQWPIYINDNTALDLKYKDYIYMVGTKVYDYFPVGPLMPYLSSSETGMVVYCLDSNLNIRWQREIHDPGVSKHFIDLVALADSGVALLMHEGDNVAPLGMDARLVVLNKTGNISGEGRHIRFVYDDGYEFCDIINTDEIFDFVIDDASHKLEDQLKALRWLPKIKPGGRLIIEDIQDIDNAITAFQETGVAFNVIDLRHIKGRYDDVIIEIIKQ
jgi:hypothetical protein